MQSIEELNEAIRNHRRNNQLSTTENTVLDVLSQYSCKDVGRSFLAKSTIAELIGKSRRTVIRVCNSLESLGIICQYKRMRLTGDRRQTSNLIVIQPVEMDDVVRNEMPVTPECHTEETLSRNSNNNTYKDTVKTDGALKRSIPAPIYNTFIPYFNDDEMYKAYGILLRAKASIDRKITVEDYPNEFIDAFQSAIFAYKRGKVRDLFRYLYATWRHVTMVIKGRLVTKKSDIAYDWLT